MSEGIDFVQRARDLAPMLDEAGDEIERRRFLPDHVVAALIDGGFFRMLQPRFLGGAELRPVLFTQVTEALAQTNASVGWCVCQNNGCSMTAAYLNREVATEMFGPPTGILAWGPPGAPYERASGRGRLSHQRQMAFRQRMPPRQMAWRAYAGGWDRQGPHHVVPEVQRADERHLAHDRPAGHCQ